MFSEKNNLRRILLLLQIFLFVSLEQILPQSLKFFSSYGAPEKSVHYPLFIIPCLLLVATFLKEKFQPFFFLCCSFILFKSFSLAFLILSFFLLFFWGVTKKKDNIKLTFGWIFILALLSFASIYYLNSVSSLSWFWLLLHVSWAIKLIAWIVTVRLYREEYSFREYLEFFFNPVFFFFTNDLNVLTPKRFFASKVNSDQMNGEKFKKFLGQSLAGIFLLVLYGLIQKYYFLNLAQLGFLGLSGVGAIVSIFVAILFHAANSTIQVSMLNAFHYQLEVDMDRPWLAKSPADYWKRMHFYVRDYIFEIIVKPILTNLLRWNVRLVNFRIMIIGIIYLLFTCTQVGYQPYRQGRTLIVSFMVTGVFVAMMAVPEILLHKKARNYFERNPWLGRIVTFMILYIGYYFIFSVRKGF